MILPLFRRASEAGTIESLYGMIVAQARREAFYREYGVADTIDGRFELVVLHLALVLRRLAGEDEKTRTKGQALFDLFCQDMDRNLREIGIGDLKVPLEMRRIGAAFYGRAKAYEAALMGGEAVLADALERNVYAGAPGRPAARLAAYTRRAAEMLAAQASGDLSQAGIPFPDPQNVEG
jgi:cytochrome b pre-mRNA-processing protein 3